MDDWFQHWFDADYMALYAHRDEAEAELAVHTVLSAAPALSHGPVLDLACGSGRHLAVLRRHNPEAFGLDLSRELLAQAPPVLRSHLLRGDMRHLPLRPCSLAGITLWFTPFGYFGEAENRQLLKSLATLLRPEGVLVMDYLNAHLVRSGLVEEDIQERDGLRVTSRRSLEGARLVKRMRLERLDSGSEREVVESVRLYDPPELEAMLRDAGLIVKTVLGDYAGGTFMAADSPRWLALAEREKP